MLYFNDLTFDISLLEIMTRSNLYSSIVENATLLRSLKPNQLGLSKIVLYA
jgi:hypothetical protein